jgi:TPR repeat protein
VFRFVSRSHLFSFSYVLLFIVLSPFTYSAVPPGQQEDNSASLAELEARAASGDAAAQFQLAFHLFQAGNPPNYSAILAWLRSSTAQHYAPAQCTLGYLYEKGLGLPRDYAKAAENYHAAALQGDSIAQNNLGYLFYTGHGVHKDLDAAFEWYRAAAEQGDPTGEGNLGYLYYLGQGTGRDYDEAANWFRPAAQQGNPYAQAALGLLYEKGQGVPLDYVSAYIWYSRAISAGLKASGERRKSLTHLLTPKQLDQANTLLKAEAGQPRTLQQQSTPSAPAAFVQSH